MMWMRNGQFLVGICGMIFGGGGLGISLSVWDRGYLGFVGEGLVGVCFPSAIFYFKFVSFL